MQLIRWSLVFFLLTFSKNNASTSIEEEFITLNRSQFIATSVYVGTEIGRNWAVGVTSKVINKTIKNPSPFFDWTIGSAIKGKELLEAIPIAEKSGARIGALTAAICAPLAFDAFIAAWKSCKKTLRPLWEDDIAQNEKATTWDKIITSVTSASVGGGIIWMILKWDRS